MPLHPRLPAFLSGRSLTAWILGLALTLGAGGVARAESASAAAGAASVPTAAAPALPDCSRPLTLGLHDHGLLYSNQTGEGIDKDIADEMARRSGCRLTLTLLPRSRIWQLIESGALDFTLSGITNPQRDKFAVFAWYVSNKYYLLVRKDVELTRVNDLLDRPAVKLGLIRSFRYGEQANALVDALEARQRITYATSLDPLYAILLEGGIQAMIIEPFDFPAIASAKLHAQTTILEFGDAPVPHGLVMSRRSLPPAQLAAWRDVIAGMRADGTMRRIFEKYFPAELARTMTQF